MIKAKRFLWPAGVAGLLAISVSIYADHASGIASLPPPREDGIMSLEQALRLRRSIRSFKPQPLTSQQIAQLCWAGQGVTEPRKGYRTCPSAGALYPLELYFVSAEGVQQYQPKSHTMRMHLEGDLRDKLQSAAMGQSSVGQAPVSFVIAGVISRTQQKYGQRAERYMLLEAGHAAQNILLQVTAMGLGAVPVGAFQDDQVSRVLKLPADQRPLYLIPVGVPR